MSQNTSNAPRKPPGARRAGSSSSILARRTFPIACSARCIGRRSISWRLNSRRCLTRVHERTKRVLKTEQHLLYYGTNGHGAWEGALANVFSPGDKMLVVESGHFSINWAQMARELGLEVEMLPSDWRLGVPAGALEDAARAKTTAHEIKGVMVVHNETATGLAHPIGDIRARDGCRRPPSDAAGRYDLVARVVRFPVR